MKNTTTDLITIEAMLTAQRDFDRVALKNAGTDAVAVKDNMEIGLFVEAGEMINEIEKHWKHWKKNHRWDKEKIMDELADVLHLILSRGVFLNVEVLHRYIKKHTDIVVQIKEFAKSVTTCGDSQYNWWSCMALFRGLVNMLGITWDEMVDQYWIKLQINIERQKAGY